MKNELIEYLTEQIQLLREGGQVFIKYGDLVPFESRGRAFVIDTRTRIKEDEPNISIIKPVGINERGYVLYVCPDCQRLHWVHKSNIQRDKPIMTGCCNKKSRSKRMYIDSNGKLVKVKRDKVYIEIN
ncbi:hypothetical protein [Sporomusa sphaeroides]|uniref:Uncharacterized protein n=1 Tax=Sporomusa sphaeroides DSM 2875 TaxID=1337886 RepID=A0ABM9W2L8_9FIRM|nr:hypothetical protein [Sporomusa sphaeroides]OLS56163.1 hypothetical protein SPSPH_25520 [Sporomusa sphaeroides DSM 2875]CVK19195.1 hypothetical protein SSPH_01844 [Sporomusa sphaeroides DSM 2875]